MAVLLSIFKGRHFPVETILLSVRWYCKYADWQPLAVQDGNLITG
jgi:transposase-like protein